MDITRQHHVRLEDDGSSARCGSTWRIVQTPREHLRDDGAPAINVDQYTVWMVLSCTAQKRHSKNSVWRVSEHCQEPKGAGEGR